jgi:hypothetical protein
MKTTKRIYAFLVEGIILLLLQYIVVFIDT